MCRDRTLFWKANEDAIKRLGKEIAKVVAEVDRNSN